MRLLGCAGRIAEPPAYNPGCCRVGVGDRRAWSHDMEHLEPEPAEHISYQPAVTSPPDSLGTHDRSAQTERQVYQAVQPFSKILGRHVVRVASEGVVAPRRVR